MRPISTPAATRRGRLAGSMLACSMLLLPLWLAACGGSESPPATTTTTTPVTTTTTVVTAEDPYAVIGPAQSCESLAGLSVGPAAISLPTTGANIGTAVAISASAPGNTLGDYCQVRGTIKPVDATAPLINFAVNLPLKWNRKAIHFGGGGFDGTLIDGTEPTRFGPADKAPALAQGYATYGDDAGHQSGSITDGTFAVNDESLANYGGNSLKKTHDVAALIIKGYYSKAPTKAYFLGTSTGGRDALLHIQRWPADYDGVIANEPALNYAGTRLSNLAVGRALYLNGGAGWVNLTKTLLVQKAVLAACDKLDGVADGIISNVETCRKLNAQILSSLRCSGGADTGNTCLSDAQLATIQTIESPLDFTTYTLANNTTRAGGYNILEGTLVAGPYTSRDLGTRAVPGNPATTADANVYLTGDQWAKYFVTRDAGFNSLTLDPLNPGAWTARVAAVSAIHDATDPNLAPFLSRGGKLILLHGLADEVISNNSTIDYYKRVVTTVGQSAVDQGIRFYTVPGMGHGTGVFIPSWDSLSALESWVEKGLAPATGIVADSVAATSGRTRPLCQWPAWPKFRGSGSIDAAVNYSCVQETGDPLACPNLPGSVTSYKGGDVFGEELRFTLDPTSLQYTVTIDASLQRSTGTVRIGTLIPQGSCAYSSAENGASFVLASGGVVQGGVAAPTGSGFLPLLAFQNSFSAAPAGGSSAFSSVAVIANVVGVQYGSGGSATPYAGSARLRNAGTFQNCRDAVTGSFMIYDAACTSTTKGYITYNTARGAFDLMTTSPTGSAVTTGGTMTGSVIMGQAGAVSVPLVLVRESATSYGMRIFAPQAAFTSGAADGQYLVQSTASEKLASTVSGSSFSLDSASGTLSPDTPVLGVVQANAAGADNFIYNGGIMSIISSTGSPFKFGAKN